MRQRIDRRNPRAYVLMDSQGLCVQQRWKDDLLMRPLGQHVQSDMGGRLEADSVYQQAQGPCDMSWSRRGWKDAGEWITRYNTLGVGHCVLQGKSVARRPESAAHSLWT